MHFLRLFRRRNFSRSNSPHGFVGDDDFRPVFDFGGDGAELGRYDGDGLVGFALLVVRGRGSVGRDSRRKARGGGGGGGGDTYFECLTNTKNNTQSALERSFRLIRNELHLPEHHLSASLSLLSSLPDLPSSPPLPQHRKYPYLITLPQNRPPLTMSHQRPTHPTILQLLGTNLARKSSIPFIKHILRRDFDFGF